MWSPPATTATGIFRPSAETKESHRPRHNTGSTPVIRMSHQGRRFAQVVKLKPECLEEYKQCHRAVWPEVLTQIKTCNIEDYSIFYDDVHSLLFASFKYVGYDYAGDMEKMAENPKVRAWWKMTDAYQQSLVPGAVSSESGHPSWWKPMEEVFYQA